MPGVTQIQITTTLIFDDGFVVTLASPAWKKDIRHGDYFSDKQLADTLKGTAKAMAKQIVKSTAVGLYTALKTRAEAEKNPNWPYYRKIKPDEPFSPN
jgi:hypothetical protein